MMLAALLCLTSLKTRSATVYWDGDYGFTPSVVVISPGESVTWFNADLFGFPVQITSAVPILDPNYFNIYLTDFGDSESKTFYSQGTVPYQSSYSDQGWVVINIPPVVAITNPPNDAVLVAPATFNIQAHATDTADDVVWDVEFLIATGGVTNSIEDDFDPPFATSLTNLPAGSYTLLAVATDYYYGQATNAVNITVGGALPITLSAPRRSGGQFLFDVTGLTVGKTNIVQASTNLTTWSGVSTNVATSSSTTVTNTFGPARRMFRLLQLP